MNMPKRGRGGRGQPPKNVQNPSPQSFPHAQTSSSDALRRPGTFSEQPSVPTMQAARGQPVRGQQPSDGRGDSTVGQISQSFEQLTMQPGGSGDAAASTSSGRGAIRGRRVLPTDILVTRPSSMTTKKGTSGKNIILQANYFKLLTTPDWCLYQYRVDFAPEEDRTIIRKGLLKLHKEKLGAYIFDGTVLYTSCRLPEKLELLSTRLSDNEHIKISIRMVGDLMKGDYHYLQFFNIIMRKCLDYLKLQLVGRNYFDASRKIDIREFKLELWPGYLTSIRQHERDILMCSEITHKVMRQETLMDILSDCYRSDNQNYRKNFSTNVIGLVVLTDYNNNTYRIEDVDFSVNPESSFSLKNGDKITYKDYYRKKYGLHITNDSQPLLVTRSKPKDRRAGQGELVYLVPELCRATGLTDSMREQFHLMKALAQHTRVNPSSRINKLLDFNERLRREPNIVREFFEWNMKLDENLLEVPARVMPPEKIVFGGNVTSMANNGDWTREMQNKRCLLAKELREWVMIGLEREKRNIQNFVDTLTRISQGIAFNVQQPRLHFIRDDRSSTYSETLEYILSKSTPQLVFCVVSNTRIDRYSAIKKKCCVDRPVPSQVYLQKNLTHKNLLSITTKVAIQMNCKLGGAPWCVEIPLEGLMVIGFDVCHDTAVQSKDFGAMVASLDRNLTRYYSVVNIHGGGEELSNEFSANICKALFAYRTHNNAFPSRIVIFRDGVGDGQVSYVYEHEVVNIKRQLNDLYGGSDKYKMAFIIVTKRINTRFFYNRGNPPPGTVVDDIVTNPVKYDFFIVSQQVREGTITPTSYSIISDNIGLDAEKLQRLTYKLTHMYYNCSCTVRVPAPCHYAHKLAFLTGKFVHRPPNSNLENTLYFL